MTAQNIVDRLLEAEDYPNVTCPRCKVLARRAPNGKLLNVQNGLYHECKRGRTLPRHGDVTRDRRGRDWGWHGHKTGDVEREAR